MSSYVKSIKQNGNNRHSLDIVRDMLSVALVSVRKTRIMYQANLSFVQVEKYLHDLLEKGLLNHDGVCYLVTEKGLEFLKLYDEYVERCKSLKEQMGRSAEERLLLERMCSCREPNSSQRSTRKMSLTGSFVK